MGRERQSKRGTDGEYESAWNGGRERQIDRGWKKGRERVMAKLEVGEYAHRSPGCHLSFSPGAPQWCQLRGQRCPVCSHLSNPAMQKINRKSL
jgi:hypothetical protein